MALACCERMGHEHAVVWGIYWSVGLCQSYVRFPDLIVTSDSAP
ncbi:MAG TPA: hypothetical protein VK932_24490 [Kofleriaceae bacterium]|nr:hypothetical protein [Kofleriaceae bacterium]